MVQLSGMRLPLSFALFTTVCAIAATIPRMRRNLVMVGTKPQSKFDTVLLELKQPVAGPHKVPQMLLNDDLLTKVVKDVGSVLYVYVMSHIIISLNKCKT